MVRPDVGQNHFTKVSIISNHLPGTDDDDDFEHTCADPESFVRGGPTLTTFFQLFDEGREDPNTTISRPSSARQLNAI